ncbi:MAG: sigma-70 family RNA polymerase sigma factor [Acidimicrobiales bacterium]
MNPFPPAVDLDATALTDERLLEIVRSGGEWAYAELYRRYEGEVRRFARSLVSADDVDDLTSESFTKMLQALRRQKGPVDHPIRYLMVTTRTSAISLRQRHRRQDDLRNHAALRADVADQQPVAMDDDLVAAFSRLSPRWRQVLWWNVIEGLSPAEISERMDLGAPAVSALLYRAKQALRAAYAEQVGEDA